MLIYSFIYIYLVYKINVIGSFLFQIVNYCIENRKTIALESLYNSIFLLTKEYLSITNLDKKLNFYNFDLSLIKICPSYSYVMYYCNKNEI